MIKLIAEITIRPHELIDLIWTQLGFDKKEILFPRSIKNQERKLKISDELMEFFEKRKKNHLVWYF